MDVKAYLIELGYSDEDATTFAADPKMAKAFEASAKRYEEAQNLHQQTTQQKNELDKWWKETAQPAILNADGGSAAAKAEAAQYKTYIQSLKDQGYPVPEEWLKGGQPVNPTPAPTPASSTFDPKKVARDFAVSTTMLHDLGEEYRELYGEPLRNTTALLEEAQQANKPLTEYVRAKFNFEGKRAERAEAKINERIQAAVKEAEERERAKAAERSNPLLAPAVTSRAAQVLEANKDNKDSWKTKQGRQEAKASRLVQFRNIAAKTA
jgi:hypothetical protein